MTSKAITPATLMREREISLPASSAPSEMVRYAMGQNASIADLERLYALQQKFEADQAKKAYDAAMAEFKRNPPEILKSKLVSYQTGKGVTEYRHAELGDICDAVVAAMAQFGLTHRWDPRQHSDGSIEISCILTHQAGHSEKATLRAAKDDSGGKNSIQAVSSTTTYLQRYTLLQVCGLATKSIVDDDGRAGGAVELTVNDEQIAAIKTKLADSGMDTAKFLKYLQVASVEAIPAASYRAVIGLIQLRPAARRDAPASA